LLVRLVLLNKYSIANDMIADYFQNQIIYET